AAPAVTAAPATTAPPAPPTSNPEDCAAAGEDPGGQQPGRPAEAVYDAFVRSDPGCAQPLMTAEALDALFSRPPQERDFQGCTETGGGGADCVFFTPGESTSAIHLFMELTAEGRWVVTQVQETEG
ncbi:MAG: hypothetical protein H0W25_07425, partial [Acidimicrobiia bacterium]|nr:hypothetical protein [Acidimicrobiia bacterium]